MNLFRAQHSTLAALGLMLGTLCVPSTSAAATSSTLYLKFLDSSSGAAVAPRTITVDGKPVEFQVEAGSLVALPMDDGNRELSVEADNFAPINFSATISGDETPVMEIELDRTEADEPEPLDPGLAGIQGFVTDADTGALLAGARVSLPDSRMTTTTAEDGRFQFTVKVPVATEDALPAVTMEVEADGYTPVRTKNMRLAPGDRRTMPVKLSRATTDTASLEFDESDEAAPDGPLRTYDWVFDVSIR